MKCAALTLMSVLVLPVGLFAETTVDKRLPAAPQGVVEIEIPAGSVKVIGWSNAEVQITGTLAAGAELDFDSEGNTIEIEIESEGHPAHSVSDIEVHVPAGSQVAVEGFELDIDVTGVTGSVEVETINGAITQSGAAKDVSIQSVNGSVDVRGAAGRIEVEVVNGKITIEESSGDLEASAVNGEVIVRGGEFENVALESVAGEVRFDAELSAQGRLDIETVSGSVYVFVAPDVQADFSIETFSGQIENGLGVGTIQEEKYLPAKELTFVTGAGGPRITVETLSGSVHIRTR